MAYELIKNADTEFAIDWAVIQRLLKSYWMAQLQSYYGQEVMLSDAHWYNPMSWALPDIAHIEVDWERVQREALQNSELDLKEFREMAANNAPWVANLISMRLDDTVKLKTSLAESMQLLSFRNHEQIDKAVHSYEAKADVAKFIRDSSAETLLVGASIMSGGAALGVLGAGSVLKGSATYQDTGSIGAGIMEGTGSFVFGYVKLGKKFSFKQDMVLAVVKAPWKAATEWVSGSSLLKASVSGALKLTGPSVDTLFKTGVAKAIFEKASLPITIFLSQDSGVADFMAKVSGKLVQRNLVEKAGKKYLLGPSSSQEVFQRPTKNTEKLMDNTTLTNKLLLYFAFVNMERGIGHGW